MQSRAEAALIRAKKVRLEAMASCQALVFAYRRSLEPPLIRYLQEESDRLGIRKRNRSTGFIEEFESEVSRKIAEHEESVNSRRLARFLRRSKR